MHRQWRESAEATNVYSNVYRGWRGSAGDYCRLTVTRMECAAIVPGFVKTEHGPSAHTEPSAPAWSPQPLAIETFYQSVTVSKNLFACCCSHIHSLFRITLRHHQRSVIISK